VIDINDQKMIGNSNPRIEFGFNVNMKYKRFNLFALGTGQHGQNMFFNSPYYWIYGTAKYSDVVWDRWTPETAATATYPELTTLTNANNFRNSTFWLDEFNWFTLQNVQLTYTLPFKFLGAGQAQAFLRGGNLFMISKIRDKAQLNVGTPPQMRSLSVGLTAVL
jgi:hypothetical protein